MENSMRLMNDAASPELIGIVTEVDDLQTTDKIVQSLNRDLVDSGFDNYQYETVRRGNKIYIERIEAL
tara:strand:- start:4234 stop:4437 length:204 start_codon:yes stop_codon:yes gene_type:complete